MNANKYTDQSLRRFEAEVDASETYNEKVFAINQLLQEAESLDRLQEEGIISFD